MPETDIEYDRQIEHFELNSRISSKYVTHFTRQFDTILKIVDNGFRPNECNEFQIYRQDYLELEVLNDWYTALAGGIENIENLIHQVPMICFSDIPYKMTSVHRKKYGKYCIALSKKWAIKKGLSPLIYVPKDSKIHAILISITSLKKSISRLSIADDDNYPHILNLNRQIDLLCEFVKPYINKINNYKFYDEREWRYTPVINHADPDNLDNYLKFNKNDFLFAIVQNTKEKNVLLEKLRDKFGYISTKQVKIKKI